MQPTIPYTLDWDGANQLVLTMRLTVINARGCTTFRLNPFRRIDTSSNTNTGLKQSGKTFLELTGSVSTGNAKDVWPQNNQVIRETEHSIHGPNQPDLVVRMSMARIKDAAASSLGPPSCLNNQELQDESFSESTGYLHRLATVMGLFCQWQIKISLR